MARKKAGTASEAPWGRGRSTGGGRQTLQTRFPTQYQQAQERVALHLGPLALDTLERIMRSGNDQAAVAAAGKILDRWVPPERQEGPDGPRLQLIISGGSRIS